MHLESELDLDSKMKGMKVNRKKGRKRPTASALQMQPATPARAPKP
jgi:hypothetical protein